MKNKKVIALVVALVAVLGIGGFVVSTGNSNNLQDNLMKQEWVFQPATGTGGDMKFTEDHATLTAMGITESYEYKISNNDEISITSTDTFGKKEVQKYSVKKTNDGYELKPTNDKAKEDGKVNLVHK